MAVADKNIIITPNTGVGSPITADPEIKFSASDGGSPDPGALDITLFARPVNSGTLSFEGSAGQLFSITNDLTGTIFSVNDVSGIPSIEVNADGTVAIAEFDGNVGIGTGSPAQKLSVVGTVRVIDAGKTDYADLGHDGTDFNFDFTNTTNVDFSGMTEIRVVGNLSTRTGGDIIIYDGTNNDTATFSHDGTDFNTTFANTTDWNITGLAALVAGNYNFNVDQTVGAGQDNYVLTYDNAGGQISLEAIPGTGSPTSASTFTVFDESTDTTTFPVFVNSATGIVIPKTGSNLTFNSSTGLLTATSLGGTLTTAAQPNITSLGTLTALQVDNININLNTISSTAGTDLNITPLAGQQIVLDGTIVIDAGSMTGITTLGFDSVSLTALQTSGEGFADNDTSIMTSAAIDDRILSYGYITGLPGSPQVVTIDGTQTIVGQKTFTADTYMTSALRLRDATNSHGTSFSAGTTSTSVTGTGSNTSLRFTATYDLSLDSNSRLQFGGSNDVEMYWDGTDMEIIGAAGNQVWNFRDGADIRIYDSGDTDYASFNHDGTNFNFDFVNTSNVDMAGAAALQMLGGMDVDIRDAGLLRIRDTGDTDYVEFQHDGTDFNMTFTNVTDWNISNLGQNRVHFNSTAGGSRLHVGGDSTGYSVIVGQTQHGGSPNVLNYRAYFAYDSYWNEATNEWEAVRTSLGRKYMMDMGYHLNAIRFRRFDGTVTSPWADSSWTDMLTIDGGNARVDLGNTYNLRWITGSGIADFDHDGTDFNSTFTSTTDWNISGFSGGNGIVLSEGTFKIDSAAPLMAWQENDQAADSGYWTAYANGGTWILGPSTDAGAVTAAIQINRSTATPTTVALGNYTFNVDQTVGAGQDNYVLTYDNGTGEISLEAATGGAADFVEAGSPIGATKTLRNEGKELALSENLRMFGVGRGSPVLDGTWANFYMLLNTFYIDHGGSLEFLQINDGVDLVLRGDGGADYPAFEARSADNTQYISMYHDGTYGYLVAAGGTSILRLNDDTYINGPMRVYDGAFTDYLQIAHNGADVDITSSGVTDINIGATGVGIRLPSTSDVSLASTDHPFQIGLTTSTNIAIDGNEIQARNNGAASDLYLNNDGGTVRIGSATAGSLYVDNGSTLRVYDGGGTDYLQIAHDGTDILYTSVNSGYHEFDNQVKIDSAAPKLAWVENDATANNGWWDMVAATEQFLFRVRGDGDVGGTNIFTVDRTGTTVDSFDIAADTSITGTLTFNDATAAINCSSDYLVINAGSGSVTGLRMEYGAGTLAGYFYGDANGLYMLNSAGANALLNPIGTSNLRIYGEIESTDLTQPWLSLDSTSAGDNWTAQGAGISVGESGKKGSAAIHLTYNGDGSGYLGMGTVDNTAATGGRPTYGHFDFDYNTRNIRVGGLLYPGNSAGTTGSSLVQSVAYMESADSQNYGSINCTGAAGSSGTYSGWSVNRRLVLMNNNSTTSGLYNDSNNHWFILCTENSSVQLYNAGVVEFQTQDSNASDNITGAEVKHWDQSFYDVGLAVMPQVTATGAVTVSDTHQHKTILITSGTGAISFVSDTTMRVNSVGWIINNSGSSNAITATTNVFWADGAGGQTGSRTLADGGWLTWWKQADTQYYITGVGIS